MRVAVTGASGFIGSHLANALVEKGDEVIGFGRRPRNQCHRLDERVDYRQWDFVLQPVAEFPPFDGIVHAGAAVEDWGDSDDVWRVNVVGTRNVISAFAATRLIFISTASVYQPLVDNVSIAETSALPSRYLNAYTSSKREAERLVGASAVDWVVLRPHAVYGPGDTTLLPRIMAAYRGGVISVPGNGRNHISLTHVSTLCSVVIRSLDPAVPSGTYNVCDAGTPTVDEAVYALFAAAGKSVKVVHIPTRIALVLAGALELAWRMFKLPHRPPITRYAVAQLAYEYTLDRTKLTRIDAGDGKYWATGIRETMMGGLADEFS